MFLKAAIYATPGYGRRLGATDVIEHAESNCTIAASKPTPMVILSLGHSASTVTALRLAKLTGSGDGNPLGSERVTGSGLHPTSNRSKWTTNRALRSETPVHDIHAYFCAKQRERTAGLVGFKWKPLVLEGEWDDAFRWLGDHREVRVVHLRRNPLDVMISGVKHGSSMCLPGASEAPGPYRDGMPTLSVKWEPSSSGEAPRRLGAHCTTADEHCASLEKKVNLTVECILPFLDASRADAELLLGKLDDYGANYQDFSYFELYEAPEPQIVEAWRRLLRFLGVAAWEVSHGDVVGASDLVETTPYAQAETVLNYEEVAARLAPTAYAHLLH